MKPTYDELVELIAQLRAEIEDLKRENAQLKERLGLNSENSSKPPSTDQKKNKQKPRGGAINGHKGYFRKLSDQADKHITSKLSQCQYCGSKNLKKRSSQFFDQVDLPEINPVVTRIECPKYRCEECGRKQVAPFPEGYDKTSFGPKLISFISLCSSAYRMSKRITQGLLKNLLNVDLQTGIGHPIRIYSLKSEDGEYYAIWRVEYRCKGCAKVFNENPGICDRCGSSEIIEAEVDFYPVG